MTNRPAPPRRSLTSLEELAAAGLIATGEDSGLDTVAARYAIAITPAMAALIDPDDPTDPIAAQFVPTSRENATTPSERNDPIGDGTHSPVPGVVHRYPDRVLLKLASVCPVYCRFCFRREMVGPDKGKPLSEAELSAALAYVSRHPEIWEVIVTGGDPFVLSPRRVRQLNERLDTIAHVAVVRWHTRVPVVATELVTPDLVAALRASHKAVYVAIHANHPRELTTEALAAIARLVDAGIVCRSQTVLLRGVNDDPATLEQLMRAFVAARVVPYYLHHVDPAPGTAHFRVPLVRARALVRGLRGRLSGLCQPMLVIDVPGGAGKVHVAPSDLETDTEGAVWLRDRNGIRHRYDWAEDDLDASAP